MDHKNLYFCKIIETFFKKTKLFNAKELRKEQALLKKTLLLTSAETPAAWHI